MRFGHLSFVLAWIVLVFQPEARSQTFDPNNIISNVDLTNVSTMSVVDIQNFLANHHSGLSTYQYNGISAAEYIYNASTTYGINPWVVLTTLEKEQSLITSANPTPA